MRVCACVCVRDAWRSRGGLLLVPTCRSSYCLRLFGRLALLALTFLAVLLPFRAIIVCEGLELLACLAFQNSRHVAKVANELLHKVTVKCVACMPEHKRSRIMRSSCGILGNRNSATLAHTQYNGALLRRKHRSILGNRNI